MADGRRALKAGAPHVSAQLPCSTAVAGAAGCWDVAREGGSKQAALPHAARRTHCIVQSAGARGRRRALKSQMRARSSVRSGAHAL